MNIGKLATAGVIALLLAGFGVMQAPAGKEKKSDADKIVGVWKIEKAVLGGKELPEEITKIVRFKFTKDGKASFGVAGKEEEGNYKITGPGKIEMTEPHGKQPGPGIYKFEGDDRVSVCVAESNAERPTEYASPAGTKQMLLVLTRVKGEDKLSKDDEKVRDKIKEAAARSISQNNLKQIGLAMHVYADGRKGAFPLHAIYSKDGKTPLLSWRVAILPYIEQDALYKEFKLDEPWDSEHNKKLIPRMPKLYEPPIGKMEKGKTVYQVFTGPNTLFEGTKLMKIAAIPNGTSNTLLAVEAKEPVVWSKPADLTLPADKDKLPAVGGMFSNGFNILMADGSVRMLPHNVEPKVLRSAVDPKGEK